MPRTVGPEKMYHQAIATRDAAEKALTKATEKVTQFEEKAAAAQQKADDARANLATLTARRDQADAIVKAIEANGGGAEAVAPVTPAEPEPVDAI